MRGWVSRISRPMQQEAPRQALLELECIRRSPASRQSATDISPPSRCLQHFTLCSRKDPSKGLAGHIFSVAPSVNSSLPHTFPPPSFVFLLLLILAKPRRLQNNANSHSLCLKDQQINRDKLSFDNTSSARTRGYLTGREAGRGARPARQWRSCQCARTL